MDMDIIGIIKKLAIEIELKQNSVFSYPVEKQKRYIDSFPQPRDLIERSFFQYKCQMKLHHSWFFIIMNMFSFPLFLFYLCKSTHQIQTEKSNKTDAVFFTDGKPANILPNDVKSRYRSIKYVDEKKSAIANEDKKYVIELWKRYPFSWHFLLKAIIKISYYRYQIDATNADTIIVCNEYSFTSSLLTDYCKKHSIRHINVMHGEKVFYMMDSFFEFDECHVWDEYYKKLFIELRASECQFYVSIPDSLKIVKVSTPKEYDYIYYLGGENRNQIDKIIRSMLRLSELGYRVAIRPHPRYTKQEDVLYINDNKIYICNKETIEDSIMSTKNVVSLFSTVLNQAYNNGVSVVIDDVTDYKKYERLKSIGYIILAKEHTLLSECIK